MERKIKLATAVSLLGLTTVACAPNPYWQAPGSSYNRPATTVRSAPSAGGVTHNHCGKVHTHALPPQGLAHHHGDGCMAGAAGSTTPPPAPAQPQGTTYPYSPYTGSTTPSTSYGYTDYSTPKPSTGTGGTYYYDYTGSGSSSSSSTPYTSSGSTYGSGSSTSSTSGSYAGGDSYTVQKGDTVFQVMRNTGVYWKDIIRLNNLQAPEYKIQPGQTLRLK